MEEKRPIDKIPSTVKYYLLDWKDSNIDEFINKYGEAKVNDFTRDKLFKMFAYATAKDLIAFTEKSTQRNA